MVQGQSKAHSSQFKMSNQHGVKPTLDQTSPTSAAHHLQPLVNMNFDIVLDAMLHCP